MTNLLNPSVICILTGLCVAGLMSLTFFLVANRPLTLSFARGEGKALYTGLMLRAVAGPYLLIQGACQSLARNEESLLWLVVCTCGALAWSLFNGALIQVVISA
jgi:hypothetical protein